MNTAPASALIGPFYPILDARFRRISTSPSTRTPEHDPMIPHVIVLEPRLVIFKIYNGYRFFLADRPSKSFGKTCVLC